MFQAVTIYKGIGNLDFPSRVFWGRITPRTPRNDPPLGNLIVYIALPFQPQIVITKTCLKPLLKLFSKNLFEAFGLLFQGSL